MTATICGHNRAALRNALKFANASNLDEVSRGWPRPDDGATACFDATCSPDVITRVDALVAVARRGALVGWAWVREVFGVETVQAARHAGASFGVWEEYGPKARVGYGR